jgi:hypothetical protein
VSELLTVKEAVALLRVKERTVLGYLRTGELEGVQMGTEGTGIYLIIRRGQMFKKKLFFLFCLPFILGLFMLSGCGILPVTVTPVAVGDSYGGGKVAYILQSGDTGYISGQTHGLIAATADQNGGATIVWSNITYTSVGTTGTAIGTGQANTTAIVGQGGCTSGAAWLCNDLTEGGYSDWYLPSQDELNELYINRVAIGGFADSPYWSSSEHSAGHAWVQGFYVGVQGTNYKTHPNRVRAVRAF